MKDIVKRLAFFIGWVLSPFTWWNDAFVNIPLSYLAANLIYYMTRLSFKWLFICAYWSSNIIGLWMIYSSGKGLVVSSKNRTKTVVLLVFSVAIYSVIVFYLDKKVKIAPLSGF